MTRIQLQKRDRIKRKIRSRVFGTATRPRLTVFRSNKFIYAQLIDDENEVTLAGTSDMKNKGTKLIGAQLVGKEIANLAKSKGIATVVFDRNGFKYTGRIKSLAEAARESGLEF